MWPNPQLPAVTFTEEIIYGKLDFLCSAYFSVEATKSNSVVKSIQMRDNDIHLTNICRESSISN